MKNYFLINKMTFHYGIMIYGIIIPYDDNYKFEKLFENYSISELLEILKNNYDSYDILTELHNNENNNNENENEEDENEVEEGEINNEEEVEENEDEENKSEIENEEINELKEFNKKNILYMHSVKHFYQTNFDKDSENENENVKYNNNIFPLPCCRFEDEENIIIGIPLKIPKDFRMFNSDKKLGFWNNEIDVETLNSNFDYIDYAEVVSNSSFILKMTHNISENIKKNFENIIDDILYDHSEYLRGILIVPNDCNSCS